MGNDNLVVIQGRVLFAMVMREMTTRFGRTAGGYVWAVLEPAATVAMLVAIFSQISRHPPLGDSFGLFYATGYMVFNIYKDISGSVSAAISANKALLTFPRITVVDAIIARFILQFLTSIFVFFLVITFLYYYTDDQSHIRFGSVFASIAMASALGLSIGIFNSIVFPYSPIWQQVFGIINRPLFLISGVFFLYDDLPVFVRDIIWWNPLIHITSLMRKGFYPIYDPGFVSPAFVLSFSAILFFLGVLLLRRLRGAVLEQ
jgi:capsular polysaccharide transport system permease protein